VSLPSLLLSSTFQVSLGMSTATRVTNISGESRRRQDAPDLRRVVHYEPLRLRRFRLSRSVRFTEPVLDLRLFTFQKFYERTYRDLSI
jgi:hypothetical protein